MKMRIFLTIVLPTTALWVAMNVHGEDAYDDWGDDWGEEQTEETNLMPISGYIESTHAYRTKNSNVISEEWVAQDVRARIQTYYQSENLTLSYKGEIFYDGITKEWHAINREAFIATTLQNAFDIKAGRQILTWGTGDLLFLNDFFPKDWVAYFSGYDQQYLKAPSDAIKLSGYTSSLNLDVVWTPKFDPDNYVTGEKLVYYSPFSKSIVAAPPPLTSENPGNSLNDGELGMRAYRTFNGTEYAAYFYHGYFKTPEGFNPETGLPYFPKLKSAGASARASLYGGIGNIEYSYWSSSESNHGNNQFVPTNQSRILTGYETEVIRNLTASVQYYGELTHDYELIKARSPEPDDRPKKYRQVLTTRWTLNTQQSKLIYSAFVFYSPSDNDYYLIPNVMYRPTDQWQFNAGANLLGGKKEQTLFGQMETNSNIYARVKFIF